MDRVNEIIYSAGLPGVPRMIPWVKFSAERRGSKPHGKGAVALHVNAWIETIKPTNGVYRPLRTSFPYAPRLNYFLPRAKLIDKPRVGFKGVHGLRQASAPLPTAGERGRRMSLHSSFLRYALSYTTGLFPKQQMHKVFLSLSTTVREGKPTGRRV
jgi:hypothetical protein